MTLGRIIRRARTDRGLTQASVASRVGTSQPRISYWEQGRYRPDEAELQKLEQVLNAPLKQQEYREVLLPRMFDDLLHHGEGQVNWAATPPPELAVVQGSGRLVAMPRLLAMAEVARDVYELIDRWYQLSSNVALTATRWKVDRWGSTVALDDRYTYCPLDRTSSVGTLRANLECGVLRPLLPRSLVRNRKMVILGTFIPVRRPPIWGLECVEAITIFDDPVHSAIMVLATLPRFPSTSFHRCTMVEREGSLMVGFECAAGFWEGFMYEAVVVALTACGFVCCTPFAHDGWKETVELAVEELVGARMLCRYGPTVVVEEGFFTELAANPQHILNRGEKSARAAITARLLTEIHEG